MQDKVSSLNLVLNNVRSSQIHIWSNELDRTKSDHSEPNHTEWTKACNAKCRQRREQSMTKVNWHKLSLDFIHH